MKHTPKRKINSAYLEGKRTCWPRWRLYTFVALILTLCMPTGCALMDKSSSMEFTPVTNPPTGIHLQGKFVWNDLLTDNVAAAKDFYGPLFGWTFEQLRGYTVVKNDGQNIGGMAQVEDKSEPPGAARWLCALSVADVDEVVALVDKEGGTVNEGPEDMKNRGRGAIISDPQGAQLLVMHAIGGDPEDKEPALGSWLWHELWSNDTEASLAFYQKLVGYDYFGEMDDYLVLTRGEQWRAGIRYSSDSDLEMRWVPVVRVADTEDMAARAKKLGGKVLVEPMATDNGGSVALLSDPSGAFLIVQYWPANLFEQEK